MLQSASVRLYASVGPELTHYDVDVEGTALVRRGGVTLPGQYALCPAACLAAVSLCGIER